MFPRDLISFTSTLYCSTFEKLKTLPDSPSGSCLFYAFLKSRNIRRVWIRVSKHGKPLSISLMKRRPSVNVAPDEWKGHCPNRKSKLTFWCNMCTLAYWPTSIQISILVLSQPMTMARNEFLFYLRIMSSILVKDLDA